MRRLADVIAQTRRRRFVGRHAELDMFRAALAASDPPFAVLHVVGPGGVGKTSILQEFSRLAEEHNRTVIRLDGRYLEPQPSALEFVVQSVQQAPSKSILLIDTYELLEPVDDWMRSRLLPQLPSETLIVIAGRNHPSAWNEDGDWSHLTKVVSVGNLPPDDSRAFLLARGVPETRHAEILDFTRGHPLALSLMAELVHQPEAESDPGVADTQTVIRILLHRFTRDVPTAVHRQALDLSALVRTTTEGLLADRFGPEAGSALFHWLRQLSFMEPGPYGLFPHDLVRVLLHDDLHWRNPAAYVDLQSSALSHLRKEVGRATGAERQRLRMDIN